MSVIQAKRPYIQATAKSKSILIIPAYYFNDNDERQPYLYLDDIIDYMKLDDYYISFADIASIIKSDTCIIVYDDNIDEDSVLVTPRDALSLLSKYSKKCDHACDHECDHTNSLIRWIKESFTKWID